MGAELIGLPLVITDEAFPYLALQRGKLDGLKHDRAAWEAAYHAELQADLAGIAPHLPATCRRILDVGGGMGGLAGVLALRYPEPSEVHLLDGVEDGPHLKAHGETFSSYVKALKFLRANGVAKVFSIEPRFAADPPPIERWCFDETRFDVVLSTQAWGFHFAPGLYLDYVRACRAPGAPVIVDVRRGRPEWLEAFCSAFGASTVIFSAAKYERHVFRA